MGLAESKRLWQFAYEGNLKEVDARTSTAEGRKEINTSKDVVRDRIHSNSALRM
jgi:hypothetical protein